MSSHPRPAAVLDVGSSMTRVGFAGEEAPRAIFPSVIGAPRHAGLVGSLLHHPTDTFAGDDALAHGGLLSLTYPIREGRVVCAAALEALLHHALYAQLPLVPDATPLMWIEPTRTDRPARAKVCEVLFEELNAPQVAMASAAAATLYATGRTSGAVLESGAGRTAVSAVWEGYALQHARRDGGVGGDALTEDLRQHLRRLGYALSTPSDGLCVEDMKRRMCYVASDPESEALAVRKRGYVDSYAMPDEQRIYLHEAQYMVPERLFTPTEDGTWGGWADVVCEVVHRAPAFTQEALFANIVLGGGNTMFPGIEQRMQREVTGILAKEGHVRRTVNCVAFADRDVAAWTGGSVIASMQTFSDLCLSQSAYHELGADAMHAKV